MVGRGQFENIIFLGKKEILFRREDFFYSILSSFLKGLLEETILKSFSILWLPLIFNGIHSDYGIRMPNLAYGNPPKMLIFPYFREVVGVKISLFFYFPIGGKGRGSEQIRTFSLLKLDIFF